MWSMVLTPPVICLSIKECYIMVSAIKNENMHLSGKNCRDSVNKSSEKFLNSISEVDGFLLKAKSPKTGMERHVSVLFYGFNFTVF